MAGKLVRFIHVSFLILLQISSIMAMSKMHFIQRISNLDAPTVALVQAPSQAPGSSSIGDEQEQHIRLVSRHRSDIPAGGDVILGGFALAFVAAIICYIRATKRNQIESSSSE
ncbi:hypothetical protein BVRB_8g186340 [Beta vulgaris subsp. vulgaris]|uniref:Uncharacterized protein n=1 Tax=Beta vulgaris subsp. vulgaris TaxID=3555 RepID=A0A0J8BVV3_BETVV|nr:hypothetical protein BVRB_8g186340 [Beta vulgaris subsp. vulgaris]